MNYKCFLTKITLIVKRKTPKTESEIEEVLKLFIQKQMNKLHKMISFCIKCLERVHMGKLFYVQKNRTQTNIMP